MPITAIDEKDLFFMREALKEALKAGEEDEVPVGAVVVVGDTIVSRGHNQTEKLNDATAHAEMIALTSAANYLGNWRLQNATVYVTIEPCIMCASAMVLSRVKKIVFGARDPKFGGCGSIFDIANDRRLNHRITVVEGVLKEEAVALLQKFFKKKRKKGAGRGTW